jgi:DNA (cytosine-5)-methyltransferase 1
MPSRFQEGACMTTFATLCSGIGAPELAWCRLGWKSVFASEIEAFPRQVLMSRHGMADARFGHGGKTMLWGDFTALRMRHLRRFGIPLPDVLCAGTPCQDFSIAGLRQSLGGDRGNLTLQFVRIANAIDNARRAAGLPPLIIVWENVPGVFSLGNAFGTILAAMVGHDAPIVLGRKQRWTDSGMVVGPRRAAAWRTFDAQYFGLAQRRERVFLVASSLDRLDPSEVLFEPEGVRRYSPPSGVARENIARPIAASSPGGSGYRNDADTAESLIVGTLNANGKAAGSATQQDAEANLLIAEPFTLAIRGRGGENALEYRQDGTANALLTPNGGRAGIGVGAIAFGGNNTSGPIKVAAALNAHGGPSGRMDFESETCVTTVAPALTSNPYGDHESREGLLVAATLTHGVDSKGKGGYAGRRREDDVNLVVTHALRAEAFDASEDGTGRGTPIVPVSISENQRAEISLKDISNALQSGGGKPGQGYQAALTATGVRRLMPVECERLQGFPYDFTNIEHRGKPASDGPRYRALGNSMAVPCLAWIGERIEAYLRQTALIAALMED